MIYNAIVIANYIVDRCYRRGEPVSNLKLQKMLYFMWVDYYREMKRPLFGDALCAWDFGPVVPEVYYEYCAYGGRPIILRCETEVLAEDEELLNKIVDDYIGVPVNVLVDRTHEVGTAWDIVYDGGTGNRKQIPFDLIKEREGLIA